MTRKLDAKAGKRTVDISFVITPDVPLTVAEAKEMLVRLAIFLVDERHIDELARNLVAPPEPAAPPPRRKLKRVK